MPMRYLITMLCAAWCACAAAQREGVVVDMETGVPLGGVVVTIDTALVSQRLTNYKGEFTIPDDADSITLALTGYEPRGLNRSELTDTIELMRTYNALNEVIIYGKLPQVGIDFAKMLESLRKEQRFTPRSTPLATFDFFSIFSAKKRKRTKERIEAIMDY